jgi:hypothetical protein
MEATDKLLGNRTQLVTGAGAHAIDAGYCAYCGKIRVDATEITSITENAVSGATGTAVTTLSWENVATLLKDDYISFENPIDSISLKNAADSMMLYLQPLRKS